MYAPHLRFTTTIATGEFFLDELVGAKAHVSLSVVQGRPYDFTGIIAVPVPASQSCVGKRRLLRYRLWVDDMWLALLEADDEPVALVGFPMSSLGVYDGPVYLGKVRGYTPAPLEYCTLDALLR
jgi:hypothetical protein